MGGIQGEAIYSAVPHLAALAVHPLCQKHGAFLIGPISGEGSVSAPFSLDQSLWLLGGKCPVVCWA